MSRNWRLIMRAIVMDTETTGLSPQEGHRIVEIGCIEIYNLVPTGKVFHHYINPQRSMPADAQRIHGLSDEFLSNYEPFAHIAPEFYAFIGNDPLIIHNAQFDIKFLNAELQRVSLPLIDNKRVICSLIMAKRKYPGAQSSLDALCKRFSIDNTKRQLHGALLDSELLAEVYLQMMGGRQAGLDLSSDHNKPISTFNDILERSRIYREPREHKPNAQELNAHKHMLNKIKDPLWVKE